MDPAPVPREDKTQESAVAITRNLRLGAYRVEIVIVVVILFLVGVIKL